jgi:catechol 2,3-dioxygenase-like lactoylglutathione lyase family enzyme
MNPHIGTVTYLVRDYDEALSYFVGKLGFQCLEDSVISEHKRWVVVSPGEERGASLLLARAKNEMEASAIGLQAGGRVFLFLYTNNFEEDYNVYRAKGVSFREEPRHEPYGTVAVFSDLYGNLWDLIQRK